MLPGQKLTIVRVLVVGFITLPIFLPFFPQISLPLLFLYEFFDLQLRPVFPLAYLFHIALKLFIYSDINSWLAMCILSSCLWLIVSFQFSGLSTDSDRRGNS
jgi:hypothetical protein